MTSYMLSDDTWMEEVEGSNVTLKGLGMVLENDL